MDEQKAAIQAYERVTSIISEKYVLTNQSTRMKQWRSGNYRPAIGRSGAREAYYGQKIGVGTTSGSHAACDVYLTACSTEAPSLENVDFGDVDQLHKKSQWSKESSSGCGEDTVFCPRSSSFLFSPSHVIYRLGLGPLEYSHGGLIYSRTFKKFQCSSPCYTSPSQVPERIAKEANIAGLGMNLIALSMPLPCRKHQGQGLTISDFSKQMPRTVEEAKPKKKRIRQTARKKAGEKSPSGSGSTTRGGSAGRRSTTGGGDSSDCT